MRIYRKTAELAKKFDAAYPEELSARLQWWSKALGIDRPRLLRMIGMSAPEARERKGKSLKKILDSPNWNANAQLVEGSLHRLLSLFHYDWHALADRIHNPVVQPDQAEPARVSRRKGEVVGLRCAPNGDASNLLINRLAEGGPESLPALLAFLTASEPGERRADF